MIKTKKCIGSPKYGIPAHNDVLVTEFSKNKGKKDGLSIVCRLCASIVAARYYIDNRDRLQEKHTEYRIENKEKIKVIQAKYYTENSEKMKKVNAKWRTENPEKVRGYRDRASSNSVGRASLLIGAARGRAKNKKIPFNLDDNIQAIAEMLESGCQLTGLSFDLNRGKAKTNSPSIDRIDSNKGYTSDNIRIIHWILNCLFGTWGEEASIPPVLAWLRKRGYTITEPK